MSFQLKPNRKESENKTIRFPLPLIEKINNVIANQDVTFSSFVLQACEYALQNILYEEKKGKNAKKIIDYVCYGYWFMWMWQSGRKKYCQH